MERAGYNKFRQDCNTTLALHFDGILQLDNLSENIERLNDSYSKVNARAEGLSVSQKDFNRAYATQQKKKAEEMSLVQRYESAA